MIETTLEQIYSKLKHIEHLLLHPAPATKGLEPFLTVGEAARLLRIGRSTLYRFSAQGLVKHYKRGKRLYFLQKDLAAFIEVGAKVSYDALAEEAHANLITKNSQKNA